MVGAISYLSFLKFIMPEDDEKNFILHRAQHGFVVLNIYPYISGHLMIVPYLHTSEFDSMPKEITDELMDLAKHSQAALREVYSPAGFNIGMNLGAAAGAEVERLEREGMVDLFLGGTTALGDELLARYEREPWW